MGCGKTNTNQASIHPKTEAHIASENTKVVPIGENGFQEDHLKKELKMPDPIIMLTPQPKEQTSTPIKHVEKPKSKEKEEIPPQHINTQPIITKE